jgi:hypothetical protein
MLMIKPEFYEKVNELKSHKSFLGCIKSLKEHQLEKEFHMELILRMMIGFEGNTKLEQYEPMSRATIGSFIDNETIRMMEDLNLESFAESFDKLNSIPIDSVFKKYNPENDSFSGAFNVSAFEMIASGIASNIDLIETQEDDYLVEKIKNIYSQQEVQDFLARGVKPIARFMKLTTFSKEYFCNS